METIKQVLMRRDNATSLEAESVIQDAIKALIYYLAQDDYDSAFYICEEFFGLEPDYNMELMELYFDSTLFLD